MRKVLKFEQTYHRSQSMYCTIKHSIGHKVDMIEQNEVDAVVPEVGRGQGIDWTRSLIFATGDFNYFI